MAVLLAIDGHCGSRGRDLAAHAFSVTLAPLVRPARGLFLYDRLGPSSVRYACLVAGAVNGIGVAFVARGRGGLTDTATRASRGRP